MSVIRHYAMTVKADAADAFLGAIHALTAALADVDGFEGASLARDIEQPLRFVFQEHWTSVDAHKAGGAALPRALFAPLMDALSEPPAGSYLTPLPL